MLGLQALQPQGQADGLPLARGLIPQVPCCETGLAKLVIITKHLRIINSECDTLT